MARHELDALTRLAGAVSATNSRNGQRRPAASENNLAAGQAAWTLGLIYLHGAGVAQDAPQARSWFERALQLGERQALAGMAWCAIDGCGGLPDPASARQWTTPLRSINPSLALYLQWLALDTLKPLRIATPNLRSGDAEPVLQNTALLQTSAREGNVHAMIELGLDAVAQAKPDEALGYFQRAAPKSEVAALNAAIVAQTLAPQTPSATADPTGARELLAEAQRAHRGDGQPVNYVQAIRLYRRAASQGSEEATHMLALIYARPGADGRLDMAWISQLGQLDLSNATPRLRAATAPRQLAREPTPLIDMLPSHWRARLPF